MLSIQIQNNCLIMSDHTVAIDHTVGTFEAVLFQDEQEF